MRGVLFALGVRDAMVGASVQMSTLRCDFEKMLSMGRSEIVAKHPESVLALVLLRRVD